jgi:hypothetical protein
MIQIFLKARLIQHADWDRAYAKIEQIIASFPLRLKRIERHSAYSRNLDKEHHDLYLNKGMLDESISFGSDEVSNIYSQSVTFYRHWDEQRKHLYGSEADTSKPITWIDSTAYTDDGMLADANGERMKDRYFEIETACTRHVLAAIGTMLENELPGRAFMSAYEYDSEEGHEVARWLSATLNEPYDVAVYWDKQRLLDSFIDHYPDRKDAVGRMDKLFYKQVKRTMEFSIAHIGHKPTLEFYASALANTRFMTWGFCDILDPWIACNSDLEPVLELLDRSRNILLSDPDNTHNIEEAESYDYRSILKHLLKQFILWTPEQRTILEMFHTNKEALETGREDLWGTLFRMGGFRVDICPMYASRDTLFETFMYHDPKHGKEYMDCIEQWIADPQNSHDASLQKIENIQSSLSNKLENKQNELNVDEIKAQKLNSEVERFIEQFPERDRVFWHEAIMLNPSYMHKDEAVESLLKSVDELHAKKKREDTNMFYFLLRSPDELRENLRRRIKDTDKVIIHCQFEEWIAQETSVNVLANLLNFLYLSLYNTQLAYARSLFFRDRHYWELIR